MSTHKPKVLWIGCSDARVPESVMYSNRPPVFRQGDIFTHRNIANQFHLADKNAIAVLTYGVTGIEGNPIKEIRVVGHTDCGGVKACHAAAHGQGKIPPDSSLWPWLAPLRALAFLHSSKPPDKLAVENVRLQAKNVKTVLGWLHRRDVEVNGYIYNVAKRELVPVSLTETDSAENELTKLVR